jgi:hypothetical protein
MPEVGILEFAVEHYKDFVRISGYFVFFVPTYSAFNEQRSDMQLTSVERS